MPLIETQTLLVGSSRRVRVTLYNADNQEQAASAFRSRLFKPSQAEEVSVLAPDPGTTSRYTVALNFNIVGQWTLRLEADSPDAVWEKVWTITPSRAPSPN